MCRPGQQVDIRLQNLEMHINQGFYLYRQNHTDREVAIDTRLISSCIIDQNHASQLQSACQTGG